MQIVEDLENKLALVKIAKDAKDLNTRVDKNTENLEVRFSSLRTKNISYLNHILFCRPWVRVRSCIVSIKKCPQH
jgi:hypothetical protein